MQMLRDLGGDAARARACGTRRDPGESRTRRGHRGCPATCVRDAQAGMPGFPSEKTRVQGTAAELASRPRVALRFRWFSSAIPCRYTIEKD